jgi:8-oxo-dGTP pyrophosphatase MutT (NUDIX family)
MLQLLILNSQFRRRSIARLHRSGDPQEDGVNHDSPLVRRRAARAVLLDPANRVLLVRFEDVRRGAHWWATPGGGLKTGETHEDAAIREIREETGCTDFELGPWIWTREHVFPSRTVRYLQNERFFLVRVPQFEARPVELEAGESQFFRGLRWWTIDELETTSDELAPAQLSTLLRALIEGGPPANPIDVGI